MSGEAQKVLRSFPTKSSEKEGPKPMPSFPDMVAYVQEKVRRYAYFSAPWSQYTSVNLISFCVPAIIRQLRGSRLQPST